MTGEPDRPEPSPPKRSARELDYEAHKIGRRPVEGLPILKPRKPEERQK